jgi:DNA-directed RNA polymerase subunit RPC12/RpoP
MPSEADAISNDHRTGKVRTDIYCTNCFKNFFAELDFDINGQHTIECPYCMHEHCRKIENGRVTGDRWDSRIQRKDAICCQVWKSDVIQAKTMTASALLRERWLNFGRQ